MDESEHEAQYRAAIRLIATEIIRGATRDAGSTGELHDLVDEYTGDAIRDLWEAITDLQKVDPEANRHVLGENSPRLSLDTAS